MGLLSPQGCQTWLDDLPKRKWDNLYDKVRGDKMTILLGVSAAMILVILLMGNDNDIDF